MKRQQITTIVTNQNESIFKKPRERQQTTTIHREAPTPTPTRGE